MFAGAGNLTRALDQARLRDAHLPARLADDEVQDRDAAHAEAARRVRDQPRRSARCGNRCTRDIRTASVPRPIRSRTWRSRRSPAGTTRRSAPANAALIIVGDIDAAAARRRRATAFGGWSESVGAPGAARGAAGSGPDAQHPRRWLERARHARARRRARPRSIWRVPCPRPICTPGRVHDVAGSILKGRLVSRLREQAGATYGVHDQQWTLAGRRLGGRDLRRGREPPPRARPRHDANALREIAQEGLSEDWVSASRGNIARAHLVGWRPRRGSPGRWPSLGTSGGR